MADHEGLAQILDFLFAANLEATDAFATARRFVDAGIFTRDAIAHLTPQKAKSLSDKKVHRKLLGAIKRMPTLEKPCASPSDNPPKRVKTEAIAPSPPLVQPGDQLVTEVVINRSPVMILWAASCAHVGAGYDWSESLSLGSACASMFARAKGASLGLYSSGPPSASRDSASGTSTVVMLLGKETPARRTEHGLRGLSPPKQRPDDLELVEPAAVFRYLSANFGSAFGASWEAMCMLATAVTPPLLMADGNRLGFTIYARFRPSVPPGLQGWGQQGRLELKALEQLCHDYGPQRIPQPATSIASTATTGQTRDHAAGAHSASSSLLETKSTCKLELCSSGVAAPGEVASAREVASSRNAKSELGEAASSASNNPSSLSISEAVYQAIQHVGGAGITIEKLAQLALGGHSDAEADVRTAVQALQLDGAVYERAGRLFAL